MNMKHIAILAVLLVLALSSHRLIGSNAGSLIDQGIEKYGKAATGCEVTLDDVSISKSKGEGKLTGLTVANPHGFITDNAIYVDDIELVLDSHQKDDTGPIHVLEVNVKAPKITYEIDSNGQSNLQTIANNVFALGKAISESQTAGKTDESGKTWRGIIINDLTINGGLITIPQALVQSQPMVVSLPIIRLHSIGTKEGGISPAEVAQTVVSAITKGVIPVASAGLAKQAREDLKTRGGAPAPDPNDPQNKALMGK